MHRQCHDSSQAILGAHLLSPCCAPAVLEDPEIYASLGAVSNNNYAMVQGDLLLLLTARSIKDATCSKKAATAAEPLVMLDQGHASSSQRIRRAKKG